MGKTGSRITLLIGIIIASIGTIGGTPIPPAMTNPTIPFAAGIWVLGIIVVLLSPLVYVSGSD